MAHFPVILSQGHAGHAPEVEVQGGVAMPAFDQVSRIERIVTALGEAGGYDVRPAQEHGDAPVLAVHDGAMLEYLAGAWERLGPGRPSGAALVFADTFPHERLRAAMGPSGEVRGPGEAGRFCFDTITGLGRDTYAAARSAVDTALTAAALVKEGTPAALGLARPPGHHVCRDLFGGGCYLNNAAVAAQWLRDGGAGTVAVLDLDYHHGNGTQSLFYDRPDVLYVSLHGAPERAFPYFVGFAEERGRGDGEGANVNVPLPAAVSGEQYRALLAPALERIADAAPDAIVVSLGLDTIEGDPSGEAALVREDLEAVGADVGALRLPSVILLEGGYAVDRLGLDLAAWMNGFRSGG